MVRDDGSHAVRVRTGSGLALGAVVLAPVGLLALGVAVGDQLQVRSASRDLAALRREVVEQRRNLEEVERAAAAIRDEIAGWGQLHVRIAEPFGPESAARRPAAGIGGVARAIERAPAGPVASDGRPGVEQLQRALAGVREEGERLRELDRLMARAGRVLAALPSRWPVHGPVNSEFGNRLSPWTSAREFHGGIDIGAPIGTPVRAPARGIVVHAGPAGDNGVAVVVDHAHDVRSQYGHLSRVVVRPGQAVERGAVLGFTGNTGRSTGPHLHYEILVASRPVNPRVFLWE